MERIRKFEPLFGEWHAESLIGAGSFGRVYKIYREEFGDRLYSALKYISIPQEREETEIMQDEGMTNDEISTYYGKIAYQLRDEIRLMNELKGNTNIVSYEDSRVIQKPDGMGYEIFIRMELLSSLRNYTKQHQLTTKDIVKIGTDICNALMLCEKRGILHRDIKPDNIFVNDNGDYKLGDFGIARRLEKTATFMSKKGTYNYMAPEVYKGEQYGPGCDICSLGLVMYYYLNRGRLPFLPPAPQPISPEDRENALVSRMSGKAMPAPCDADPQLASIVLKACAYDQRDRFASAAEMKKALLAYEKEEHAAYAPPAAAAPAAHPEIDRTLSVMGGGLFANAGANAAKAGSSFAAPEAFDPQDADKTQSLRRQMPQQPQAQWQQPAGTYQQPVRPMQQAQAQRQQPQTQWQQPQTPMQQPQTQWQHPAGSYQQPVRPMQQPTGTYNANVSDKPKKKRTGLIIGIVGFAAAVALAFGIMAILGVFGGKEETRSRSKSNKTADGQSQNEVETRPNVDENKVLADDTHAAWVAHGNYLLADGTENGWGGKDAEVYEKSSLRAISFDELKGIDNRLYDTLARKDVKYLYTIDILLGTNDPGWITKCMKNGKLYNASGSYAIKVAQCSCEVDGSVKVYAEEQWISDPKTAYVEVLTPDTLFMPTWQEEKDKNGFSWADNPVCIGGAGLYTLVIAQYNNASEPGKPGYGMALILRNAREGIGYEEIIPFNAADHTYGIVGSFEGSNWGEGPDVRMTQVNSNTWSGEVTLRAGDEFKVRADSDWTYSWGNGEDNFKCEADGTYIITITFNGSDGIVTVRRK